MDNNEMKVVKRDGHDQNISFDKILKRVKTLGNEVGIKISYTQLVMKVIDQLYNGIETTKIDELTAEQCASMSTIHPDYSILASRIVISNLHKNTNNSFYESMKTLYNFHDIHNNHTPLIHHNTFKVIEENKEFLDNIIDGERDYLIDYFGYKTLERSYLMNINKKIIERPQYMWLRVAIGIHGNNLKNIEETYYYMSNKYFTHATPTLFNAGTPRPQLSSCFLLAMEDDSIDGIYNTLKDCAKISKWAGGIGLHIHNVRAEGSHIRGTNGTSNGIVPMLGVFNKTAKYVDQGGGKRNGSFAIYLSPDHPDIELFLELKKNQGDEEMRARDLFYALWIPDLFMEKVITNDDWYTFCPDKCPGLADCYGEEYNNLYYRYVSENKYNSKLKARELWFKILDSQMETGVPYLLFKDAANSKSNQKNLGVIKSSNLCTEILEYSDKNESAVCNLASIGLSKFVDVKNKSFNYEMLHKITKIVTKNLNTVIDVNFYPTDKTKRSNMLHRPIGIGIQGLADVFVMMDIAYHSEEAKTINKNIFETIYHASLEQSNEIAMERCEIMKKLKSSYCDKNTDIWSYNNESKWSYTDKIDICQSYSTNNNDISSLLETVTPIEKEITRNNIDVLGSYSSFEGSPASKGILQFDMWNVEPSSRYNWDKLKYKIIKYGLRNSLLVAPMPTASTSQILGNNECFEPFTSNIYTRRVLAGEFIIVNKYLMRELIDLGLWSENMKNKIITNKGSIQNIESIPEHIKNKYKVVWEIPMKHLIDMSKDRGAYICQSQSLNLWSEAPNYNSLTSMHFYSWKSGLKTGLYYLRRKPAHQVQQFTIEPEKKSNNNNNNNDNDNELETCEMCSG